MKPLKAASLTFKHKGRGSLTLALVIYISGAAFETSLAIFISTCVLWKTQLQSGSLASHSYVLLRFLWIGLQPPCCEARRNAHVSWGTLCEDGACNTMCMKEAAVAAQISAIREICMISNVLFISFGFLKFWLNKTGLVVLVVSVVIA